MLLCKKLRVAPRDHHAAAALRFKPQDRRAKPGAKSERPGKKLMGISFPKMKNQILF